MMTGVYIHVPFCSKKCPYCDFYSCNYSIKSAEKYKNAVIRNIRNLPYADVDTVYFGGGTPSIIPSEYIAEIIEALECRFNLISPEITIEINPCTVTEAKLNSYKIAGINRLSVGVQSGNNDELEFLGRSHSFEKAADTIMLAAETGFYNISCDLMIALKDQTFEKLECSVTNIINLPIQHVSSYILKVEKETPFYKNKTWRLLPDDDQIADLYLYTVKLLEESGFKQYEISNFSKIGYKSRHNMKYWKCEEYLGIGPSAHSYFNGKRYYVPDDLDSFCENDHQIIINENAEPGSGNERIMLGLRLTEGINLEDFDNNLDLYKRSMKYCKNGFAELNDNYLKLTPKGFLVSNSIITDLLYGNGM